MMMMTALAMAAETHSAPRGPWQPSAVVRDGQAPPRPQVTHHTIDVTSADGSHTRRVGFAAVMSDDPSLYAHHKSPGAFGGATVTNPWEALGKYKKVLEEEEGCDVMVPLQHTYVPE